MEVGVAVGPAISVFHGVGVCGEELQPAFYASTVLADIGAVINRLVVGVDQERDKPEITADALDGSDYGTGLEVEGWPVSFVIEGGAADEEDGANGAVRLFVVEGGAETVYVGLAVQAEGAGVVGGGVPVGIHQNRGSGEFVENLAKDDLHFRGEDELGTLAFMGRSQVEILFKKFRH